MKRKAVTFVIILVCFLLQSTVFNRLSIGSVSPNLLVIVTASFGFMRGQKSGMYVGLACGLFTDLFWGGELGFHMMIFVLIAGSYTPVCLIVLGGRQGYTLLTVVWGIAIIGMIVKALWITCPKWFSSVIYIVMGWVCVAVFGTLLRTLPEQAFLWLLAGGIIYTIGGVIYALKLPIFNQNHKYFGSHEIFHLFVMAGSICHFIFMYHYVA